MPANTYNQLAAMDCLKNTNNTKKKRIEKSEKNSLQFCYPLVEFCKFDSRLPVSFSVGSMIRQLIVICKYQGLNISKGVAF